MLVKDLINSDLFQIWLEKNFPYKRGKQGPDIWETNKDSEYVGAILEEFGLDDDMDIEILDDEIFINEIGQIITRKRLE